MKVTSEYKDRRIIIDLDEFEAGCLYGVLGRLICPPSKVGDILYKLYKELDKQDLRKHATCKSFKVEFIDE